MGILSNIFHKIFPGNHPAASQGEQAAGAAASVRAEAQPAPAAPVGAPAAPAINPAIPQVDVAAILDKMAQDAGQPLNWRTSIVDLLKLLHLDSSLESRKELARELHYSGDTGDSAGMNVWLHRQVMTKLAANGGKVPAELAD